jgi:multiple sugar transport system permease protein
VRVATRTRAAVIPRAAVVRGAQRPKRKSGEAVTAWAYVLPASLIILGLGILPMVWSLVLSLQTSDLITPAEWVGLKNYRVISQDPGFRAAVGHTLLYTGLFVPLAIAGGLGLALLLNRKVRFIGVYRTLVFVPFVISATAQGVLFSFIFDSHFGLANAVLHWFRIPPQGFFADHNQALYMLVLIGLWSGIGFCVVVYLAGLQDIQEELVEAAALDGAGRWATFRYVVWPALQPVTIFLLVWETLQALQVFDLVFVTTRGGPLESTTVVVFFVWQQAFELFNAGYAAAAAYVLAFGLLLLSIGVRFARRRDHEVVSRR